MLYLHNSKMRLPPQFTMGEKHLILELSMKQWWKGKGSRQLLQLWLWPLPEEEAWVIAAACPPATLLLLPRLLPLFNTHHCLPLLQCQQTPSPFQPGALSMTLTWLGSSNSSMAALAPVTGTRSQQLLSEDGENGVCVGVGGQGGGTLRL